MTFETLPADEDLDLAGGEQPGEEFVVNQGSELSIEAANIKLSKENTQLKLEWEPPLIALCDSFNVNYTVTSLKHPKTFTIKTMTTFATMKMLVGHQLDIKINCMFEGGVSKQWWAHRLVDLGSKCFVMGLERLGLDSGIYSIEESIGIENRWKESRTDRETRNRNQKESEKVESGVH